MDAHRSLFKRYNITLSRDDVKKLDEICMHRGYINKDGSPRRSTMLQRLIQEYEKF